MKVDQMVVAHLDELVKLGEEVLSTQRPPPEWILDDHYVDGGLAHQWATSTKSLLSRVFGADSEHYTAFCRLTKSRLTYSPVYEALGTLKAAKRDYEHGHLFHLRQLIEAEVLSDFLGQAEHLLAQGYHQAAVVVAGSVLEVGLKKACIAHGVKLPGKPRIDTMNAELAKAGLYTGFMQERVSAISDLRDRAALGQGDTLEGAEAERAVGSIRRLMETLM